MLRQALREIALMAPPELREAARAVAADIGAAHGLPDYRVYVSQQGRGRAVEIDFHAPTGLPPRRLEEWDAIREEIRLRLAGDDPHYWLTVTFTTLPPDDAAQPVGGSTASPR